MIPMAGGERQTVDSALLQRLPFLACPHVPCTPETLSIQQLPAPQRPDLEQSGEAGLLGRGWPAQPFLLLALSMRYAKERWTPPASLWLPQETTPDSNNTSSFSHSLETRGWKPASLELESTCVQGHAPHGGSGVGVGLLLASSSFRSRPLVPLACHSHLCLGGPAASSVPVSWSSL